MFKLIKNVDIISSEFKGIGDILVCNDKIVKISSYISTEKLDVSVIDGNGKTAIPGYLDQHVHITGGGGEGGYTTKIPELGLTKCVEAGVTTVVGLLGTDATTRTVESLVAKTKALREEGITAYCLTGSYDFPSPTVTGSVKRDMLYISEVIGVKLAMSDHRSSYPTKEELIRLSAQVCQAALLSGKPGVIHIHMGTGKAGLKPLFELLKETDIPIKHFRPTHVKKIMADAVAFAKMGGYIDLTATEKPTDAVDTFMELIDKGVPPNLITVSSDANGSSPKWNKKNEYVGIGVSKMTSLHQFILELVQNRGLPLDMAIDFVTANVARALNIFPQKGTLSVGSDADILLLDKNMAIDTVMSNGKMMMWNKELLVKGVFEEI